MMRNKQQRMEMELRKVRLGEIADVDISSVDKKCKEEESPVRLCNFVDVYYNWAVTADMEHGFMEATANTNEIDRFKLKRGQVALTKDSETRCDIGIATYIADDFANSILGYHNALITPCADKLNGKYLNALLHTDYARKYFANNATGSGQRYALSIDALNDFGVPLVSLREQERIGEIFSLIDRKIALNRRMNATLEAMARQLYDYWFLQFDFPDAHGKPYKSSGGKMTWNNKLKREIPEGWEVMPIGEILDKYPSTKRYETKDYLPVGRYPIVDQGDAFIVGYTNEEENLLRRHPAVLFGDHSTKVKYLDFDFARGADGTQVLYSSHSAICQYYLYLAVSSMQIPNPGYSRHFKYLKDMPITVPDMRTASEFERIILPISKEWTKNIFCNTSLTRLRTTLLPLLMESLL